MTKLFVCSAGGLLAITGAAKLVSSFGSAAVLKNAEPIFHAQFRYVFWVVGTLELAVALFCFLSKGTELKAALIAWLASAFFTYRLGLVFIDYHRPCGCLGSLTDTLHIPDHTADTAMKFILGYLLIGSFATLFSMRKPSEEKDSNPLLGKNAICDKRN